ncbi:MAG: molybdate ABC transporter substrate-binding protein [Fusobacteriaceae bacterium]|nr:molybdate ABC transporter substrate-binding protein [Fusobacteriaceae bacterium]MBN2838825.1 molybdate ABC transporter substrate-binding protein [Fusobacteriaceae bacterium]
MKKIFIILCFILNSLVFADTLTISAAASLKEVMTDIKSEYEKTYPSDKIIFNFGGSGALQKQIENGAPVDIFISAATKQMNELVNKNLILPNSNFILLENSIVLIKPKNSKLKVSSFNDLIKPEVKKIAIGEISSVPVGQYSMEIFNNLKINEKISNKLIYGKDVLSVLSWVESDNVDLGIVYKTDAISSTKVIIVANAPANSHKPVEYPIGIVKNSKNITKSQQFIQFLKSNKAKALFKKYGFLTK